MPQASPLSEAGGPERATKAAILFGDVVPRNPLAAVGNRQSAFREIRDPFDDVPRPCTGGVGPGGFQVIECHCRTVTTHDWLSLRNFVPNCGGARSQPSSLSLLVDKGVDSTATGPQSTDDDSAGIRWGSEPRVPVPTKWLRSNGTAAHPRFTLYGRRFLGWRRSTDPGATVMPHASPAACEGTAAPPTWFP